MLRLKNQFTYLTDDDISILTNISQHVDFNKKHQLVEPGKLNFNFFYIIKGVVRGYIITDDGEEKNIFISDENYFVGAPECLLKSLPTRYYFEALPKTELYVFDIRTLEKSALVNQNLTLLYIESLKKIIFQFATRIEGFVSLQPEERFLDLHQNRPVLCSKVLKKQIAGFLGISPNSLSRIISRLEKSNSLT